jgi:hypothetical protein
MRSAPKQVYDEPSEILVAFDLLVPSSRALLCAFRRAWGPSATVESLGYGRVVLLVRPGGALGLAR